MLSGSAISWLEILLALGIPGLAWYCYLVWKPRTHRPSFRNLKPLTAGTPRASASSTPATPSPAAPSSRKSTTSAPAEASTLSGQLNDHGATEILQFLESNRKSGLLCVERDQPIGLAYFDKGWITYAQTMNENGEKAVREMLGLDRGAFHFFAQKRLTQSNCRLMPTQVLLDWARETDEAREFTQSAIL